MLVYCTPQKSAKWLEQKWSSNTAPPLVTRGGYVVGWCRTNHSIRIPPLQLYENGNFDLAITLLMLYTPNFEVYLSKLHIAPSSLGLSCYGKTVVIACMQWNWNVIEKLINSTNAGSDCVTLFDVLEQAGLIHSTYHEVTEYQIWFPFVKGLVGYNIFLDDKSLIPISLAHHLNEICIWYPVKFEG